MDHYIETLEKLGGLRLIRRGTVGRTGHRMAMLGDGSGMKLELIEDPAADAPRLLHLAFRSDDVAGACEALPRNDWTLLHGPNVLPAAHALSALFRDSAGLHLQIIDYEPSSPDLVQWDAAPSDQARRS